MLEEALREIGTEPSEEMVSKLRKYYEMIIEKNKVMNLTAITDEREFVYKHFADSLAGMAWIACGDPCEKCGDPKRSCGCAAASGKGTAAASDKGTAAASDKGTAAASDKGTAAASGVENAKRSLPKKVIDVGTGAGFPGMVLKIAYPELDMTLFDSLKKRLTFLDEVIEELELSGVRTLHGRAEDIGHDKAHRGMYDIVTARAVANLSTISEYCLPLLKKGGIFVAYKSAQAAEEAENAKNAIALLGGKVREIKEFTLPGTDYKRVLLFIEKVKDTPAKYPRKAGTPAKEPL